MFINFSIIFASIVGAIAGVAISFITNCTLIEISKRHYFALYFSGFFFLTGFFILSKSCRAKDTNYTNPDYIHVQERDVYRIKALLILSILLIISAIITLFLNTQFFIHINYLVKVPAYAILGISVTFALTISALDIINLAFHMFQKEDSKPVINSGTQIILVVIICCIMGLLFGLIFGLLDVEDASIYHIKQALLKEENYCLPIGIVLGAIAGFLSAASDKDYIEIESERKDGFKPLNTIEEEI